MPYEGNIRKFYAFSFFSGLSFAEVVFYLFLLSNGLNYFQIMLLEAWFTLIILIMLIPLGILADFWSRKNILLIGALGAFIGSIIYAMSSSFVFFLIAETFWAISIAIMTGTRTSFIYESLKCSNLQDKSKKIFSHSTFYFMLGSVIASLVGSFVASTYSLRATLYLMVISQVMKFLIVLTLEEPITMKGIIREMFLENIKSAVKFVVKNDLLRFLISVNILVSLVSWTGGIYFQPYMQNVGIKVILFGFVFASVSLASAIFSREAHWIEESLGMKKTIMLYVIIPAVGYLAMSLLLDPIIAVIGIAMVTIMNRFMEPIFADYYNKIIGSKNRATVNSFIGFIETLIFTMISPVIGHFSDVMGIPIVFLSFSAVAFLVAIFAGVKFIRIK